VFESTESTIRRKCWHYCAPLTPGKRERLLPKLWPKSTARCITTPSSRSLQSWTNVACAREKESRFQCGSSLASRNGMTWCRAMTGWANTSKPSMS